MTFESGFSLTETRDGDRAVLTLGGELDLVTAPELSLAIGIHLREGRPVLVDLGEVTFIDSSGLAAIVTGAQDQASRALISLAPSKHPQPNRLLEITGIAELLAQRAEG